MKYLEFIGISRKKRDEAYKLANFLVNFIKNITKKEVEITEHKSYDKWSVPGEKQLDTITISIYHGDIYNRLDKTEFINFYFNPNIKKKLKKNNEFILEIMKPKPGPLRPVLTELQNIKNFLENLHMGNVYSESWGNVNNKTIKFDIRLLINPDNIKNIVKQINQDDFDLFLSAEKYNL